MQQLRLPSSMPSRQLKPDASQASPVIWIRELLILRELKAGDEFVARRMQFRRGLNILWSKPLPPEVEHLPFENGLHGHTAGKTAFCRFLRYVLGEPSFGDEDLQRAIRNRFENGWVLAEVVVQDRSWAVARSIGITSASFANPNKSLEFLRQSDIPRGEFSQYLAALEEASTGRLPVKRFPDTDTQLRWQHVLPWLTRDQECRLAKLPEWRDTLSKSGSPTLNVDSRQVVVRSVLNLISDEENQEIAENERLNREKDRARAELPQLLHQSQVDRDRLVTAFGSELPQFDDGLYSTAVESAINAKRDDLEGERKQTEATATQIRDRDHELSSILVEKGKAERNREEASQRLATEEKRLQACEHKLTGKQRDEFFRQIQSNELCSVPLRDAIEAGCPLATGRPLQLTQHQIDTAFDQTVQQLKARIPEFRQAVRQTTQAVSELQTKEEEVSRELGCLRRQQEESRTRLIRAEGRLESLETLANQAREAWKEARRLEDVIPAIQQRIEVSQERQAEIRKNREKSLSRMSILFDYVMRAFLGDQLEGTVEFFGRSINLRAEYNGERRSMAVETVKILAFDIASMLLSIEGEGFHPRFLVHDSPQEGGVDRAIYRHLFTLLRDVEDCFAGIEPSFQYFVTTTEPPPQSIAQSPWLLEPVFDASRPESRFLGVDL